MTRKASSVGEKLQAIRGFIAASAIALIAGATISVSAVVAGAQEPAPAASDMARLVGNWSGRTQDDGVLRVTISADRILGFKFTGGEKDHGIGTFRLQSPDQLLYTPLNETNAEHWTYGFDSAGHLRLKMEEDDPKDVEQYTLSRAKP
jgi:hypothetical protein